MLSFHLNGPIEGSALQKVHCVFGLGLVLFLCAGEGCSTLMFFKVFVSPFFGFFQLTELSPFCFVESFVHVKVCFVYLWLPFILSQILSSSYNFTNAHESSFYQLSWKFPFYIQKNIRAYQNNLYKENCRARNYFLLSAI